METQPFALARVADTVKPIAHWNSNPVTLARLDVMAHAVAAAERPTKANRARYEAAKKRLAQAEIALQQEAKQIRQIIDDFLASADSTPPAPTGGA